MDQLKGWSDQLKGRFDQVQGRLDQLKGVGGVDLGGQEMGGIGDLGKGIVDLVKREWVLLRGLGFKVSGSRVLDAYRYLGREHVGTGMVLGTFVLRCLRYGTEMSPFVLR